MQDEVVNKFEDVDLGRINYEMIKTWALYLNKQLIVPEELREHHETILKMVRFWEQEGVPITSVFPVFQELN